MAGNSDDLPRREDVLSDMAGLRLGMTLRDYLAGQAMQAILGAVSAWSQDAGTREELAKRAYLVADAMIAERAK